MRLGFDRSANARGLALEISIVIEVNDMDHLMLERVIDVFRKQLMILARKHDLYPAADVLARAQHPRRVANPRRWELTRKILYVKMMKSIIQFINRWQYPVTWFLRLGRLYQKRLLEQAEIGRQRIGTAFFPVHGRLTYIV